MFNLIRSRPLTKLLLLIKHSPRCLSISKLDLVQSSRNIEEFLKSIDYSYSNDQLTKSLHASLEMIHDQYQSFKIAPSTKYSYDKNASKWNSIYLQIENDRQSRQGDFQKENLEELLLLHLRYGRYLRTAFIYRFITFKINHSLDDISQFILQSTKTDQYLNENSFPLICELGYFVYCLASENNSINVQSLLAQTQIVPYLRSSLYRTLTENGSIILVNHLCSSLYSTLAIPEVASIPQWSEVLLQYLQKQRSSLLNILQYLTFLQRHSIGSMSWPFLSLLDEYLNEVAIHQDDLEVICQLLILLSSLNYSHQLFHQTILKKIEKFTETTFDRKLFSRLIFYLCVNDPTNSFRSRSIIVQLSRDIYTHFLEDKQVKSAQWIVQAQYGMMLQNIYNYQLLFATVQDQYFPLLFRDLGTNSATIQRQLLDIHYALALDRPFVSRSLLNADTVVYLQKISKQYQSSIRSNQKTYQKFRDDLNQSLNEIYGPSTSQIIHTDDKYPYLLFDFLEVNLPSKSIDSDRQGSLKMAVVPILNSMLIRQKRSDGSLLHLFSAQTTMRCRLLEKHGYQVIPIFHGKYLGALQQNDLSNFFQIQLTH